MKFDLAIYWPDLDLPEWPDRGPIPGEPMGPWRARVKALLLRRDLVCRGCEQPWEGITPHMHESLVTRGDVMGWPKEWRHLIANPMIAILLCPSCHLGLDGKIPPERTMVFAEHLGRYGRDLILHLRSLPFHPDSHPLKGLIYGY